MGTGLRGFGWYKWDLLLAIYMEFGFAEFPYSAVAKLMGFNRKTFFSLHQDGWLTNKKSGKRTSTWNMSTAASTVLFPDNLPNELASTPGGKVRRSSHSKRASLHAELFAKEIIEAIEFFTRVEVKS